MDMNYYLAREQVERALGGAASGASAREAHIATANHYRAMIERRRCSAHAHVDGSTLLPFGGTLTA